MRKLVFFSIIMGLFVADFNGSAFAARAKSSKSSSTLGSATANMATKGTTATPTKTTARAATTRGNVVKLGSSNVKNAPMMKPGTSGSVSARAAAKQKVINMGTKVEGVIENTVVSEECQTAYYGCMDAFCMLDNASGGRCQCSDRNKDLDLVLEEIMKLDEQSLAMATEGVERLQMGENAEEIMARAKAAADSVLTKASPTNPTSTQNSGSKARTLDLSSWKKNSLFDEDDDLFGEENSLFNNVVEDSLADKTGDALQTAAANICVTRIPEQCQSSASFLRLTYAQKIKSDCSAYENSLKQQRASSAEKLQTAQKALRDTALEMYQNENKYDFGQCVTQFKRCLQTTAECGDDYSGCLADTAILGELYKGNKKSGKSKVATTVIKTGATSITISSATYDIFNTKKDMCSSVTKQCVNANKKNAVWNQVIKDLAPVIYTAEYNAASNNRMNCISTIVTCVQKVCASKWDETTDNYDACLSDPESINNYCALEKKRCGDEDSETNVTNYVMAKLAALKVDKCTKDVKECLLSEDRCGPDYSGCVGLDTDTIVDLCPEDKLISCQSQNGGRTAEDVREYIAQIAQGLALNIDNKFATVCQNAVDAAYARVCGAELSGGEEDEYESGGDLSDSCPNLVMSHNETKGTMKWEYCKKSTGQDECYPDLSLFGNDDIKNGKIFPKITGTLTDLGDLRFDAKGKCGITEDNPNNAGATSDDSYFCVKDNTDPDGVLKEILVSMNRDYSLIMNRIANDSTVKNCREGRTFQGISKRGRDNKNKDEAATIGRQEGRFENILNTAESEISGKVINSVLADYYSELNALKDSGQGEEMYQEITKRRLQIIVNEFMLKILQGKSSMCDLTETEYTNLMANEELQNALKNEQDSVNLTACEAKAEKPNFCSKPRANGTNKYIESCPNGNAGTRTYRKTPSYDPTTNTCNVKIETYNCKSTGINRKNRDKCIRWDVNNPNNVETKVEKMPEWNDMGSTFFKADKNGEVCPNE